MRLKNLTLLLCALLAQAPACGGTGGAREAQATRATATPATAQTPVPAAPSPPRSATCALLTDEEVREVQGEAPAVAQGTEHTAGAVATSQCFYRLPTFSKSINLEVARAAPGSPAGAVGDYWRKLFGAEAAARRARKLELEEVAKREREELLARERAAGGVREGGRRRKKDREAEEAPPRRVEGVGEEAYWIGNQTAASLYVLTKGAVVRVSPAAGDAEDVKIQKAAELARRALKRL